jgi:thiamine biosynthesis protein ThiI
VDKTYPIRSEEFSARVGSFVLECRPGWSVDLRHPELPVRIDIVNRRALVTVRRHEGSGGLPVGVSGRGMLLISGGIDSPVAASLMLRRGLRLDLLHFHSAPFTGTASQEKVREVARLLLPMQPSIELLMVPFAEPIQKQIVEKTPSRYRVILYRRFMARLAVLAARATGASCLVTGESLGQVASQTIENLTTIEATTDLPILRPLIGMGKTQIIDEARRLGSFEISLEPHDDCCSYLMPRHPMTRTTPGELEEVEEGLEVGRLVAATWANVTRETLRLGGS